MKLFACYLGGMAKWCNIELHDLQFSIWEEIEDCFDDLRSKRFWDKNRVHIDAFLELKYINWYEVVLKKWEKSGDEQKLFVVNAGWYVPGFFGEKHEIWFYVADKKSTATKIALEHLCKNQDKQHQDNLYDVDDCIALEEVWWFHIHLVPTVLEQDFMPMRAGYGTFDKKITPKITHLNY